MSSLLLAVALFLGVSARSEPRPADVVPPSCVFVPGGRTRIGSEAAAIKRLLETDPDCIPFAGTLWGETPQQEVAVEDFFLMATEVTHEQYEAYLRATLTRPPFTWGRAAIAVARDEWLAQLEKRREDAAASAPAAPFEEQHPFDEQHWWSENWRGKPFAIPAGDALAPVVFVDWHDADAYARWAGLRLMSELEYERAVRGDTTRAYPWGDEWDAERFAATNEFPRAGGPFLVGSFPAGASKQGVFDLAGNVWEWTSSAYAPFPGYELKVYEFGYGAKSRQVNAIADFSPEQRVAVGGSYRNGRLMARATTRRGTDPLQSSDALGFRCAASERPCLDVAARLLATDLTPNALPREGGAAVELDGTRPVGAERWDATPSAFRSAPAGYAVITAHRHVTFVPVRQIAATDAATFERLTHERLGSDGHALTLGVLATDVALVEPALAPGTYFVAARARGKRRVDDPRNDRGAAFELAADLDPALDSIVFCALDGTPRATIVQRVELTAQRDPRVTFLDPVATPRTDGPPITERTLRLEPWIASRIRGKGFAFTLSLRAEPGAFDGAWRATR